MSQEWEINPAAAAPGEAADRAHRLSVPRRSYREGAYLPGRLR
jgi:hypothetical protein